MARCLGLVYTTVNKVEQVVINKDRSRHEKVILFEKLKPYTTQNPQPIRSRSFMTSATLGGGEAQSNSDIY